MKKKNFLSLIFLALFFTVHLPVMAEPAPPPGNPFGGGQPGAPSDNTDFEDEGDTVPPGVDFGFTPPQGAPGLNPNAGLPPLNPGQPPSPPGQAPPGRNAFQAPSQPSNPRPPNNGYVRRGTGPRTPPGPRTDAPSRPESPGTTASPGSGAGTLNPGTATISTPSGGKATVSMKPAPKLADYLELDTAVKGLEVKNFNLPDKEIKDVVTLISKWTGKNFILDSKVRGKITIIGPAQVTLQEAYQAFLSALEANGLTTVQSGKFIRVIESAEARRAPVKTYSGDYAPKDDQFITRIFQLKYINADEVQREFRDLTTRQGKLFAYEPTNSIIITDTGSNIQRIKEILETLDVKSFESTLHVLKIKGGGSAKAISEMLSAIYGDPKGTNTSGGSRSFRRSALERTRGGGIISKIIPDEGTNSLVVLANQAGFDQLRQLVAKLDLKNLDTGRIHVYYCEYAKAEDLASTLASLAGGGGGKSPKQSSTSPSPGGAPGTNPLGGASPVSSGPVSAELGEGVKITSDAATNSLVITANSSDYQTLRRVLKKLDIPRLQVYVQTAILEVAVDDKDTWTPNLINGVPGSGFGGGFIGDSEALTGLLSGTTLPSGASVPFMLGPRFNATVAGKGIQVSTFMGLLSFLTSNTNTSVLSTPQILALDNEKAEFQVQDDIPVVGSTTNATATSPSVTNIERKKVGIDIKLTPHVNAASGQIRMEIEQTVDSIKDSLPAGLDQKKIQSIATTTRKTVTQVVTKDGDYVALGGLMSDKVNETIQKVPLLGDIPILGWFFKTRTNQVTKTNLIILMQPKIIGTTLAAANQIKGRFAERDEFLKDNASGEDVYEKPVGRMKEELEAQEARAQDEPVFDYRNNAEDDEIPVTEKKEPKISKVRRQPVKPPAEPPLQPPADPNTGLPPADEATKAKSKDPLENPEAPLLPESP